MNENIDLTKILKDCPKGWELYSCIHGKVRFNRLDSCTFPVSVELSDGFDESFSRDGRFTNLPQSECCLFPSSDQRDWSKFSAPWYKKEMSTIARIEKQGEQEEPQVYDTEDGKIITYSETDGYKFDEPNFHENEREWLYIVSDVLTWKDGIGQYLDDKRVQELAKKLCSKYAKKLYNSSVLSNLSNTGENKQKFDPKTLKPFYKVLVKCTSIYNSNLVWRVGLFSYFHVEDDSIRVYTLGSDDNAPNSYVIPYNDNTKHLVNMTEEAPEYYRYWED